MNNQYENEMLTVDEEAVGSPVEEKPFVPRRPNPSEWFVKDVKFTVTRGEELFLFIMAGFMAVILMISVIFFATTAKDWTTPTAPEQGSQEETQTEPPVNTPDLDKGDFADGEKGNVLYKDASDIKTIDLSGLSATQAAVAKVSDGKIIAGQGTDQRIYPASLTKVMTLIVAVEHLRSQEALQETVTVSAAVVDAMKAEGASGMGLEAGEKLTVEALLYALMLRSDGVAACELARYIAGTEDAFVALMNQKATDMGLTGTHFTNPTGLYHENHYSTCRDLATIMGYAMEMSLCRKIMTEDAFDADCTTTNGASFQYHIYHNLLVTYYNMYDELNPGTAGKLTVVTGKTGYTPESKYCLATCAMGADGSYYVCVTVGASGYEDCIRAYQALYSGYVD